MCFLHAIETASHECRIVERRLLLGHSFSNLIDLDLDRKQHEAIYLCGGLAAHC